MLSVQDVLSDLHRTEEPPVKTAAVVGTPDLGTARTALQQSLVNVTSAQQAKTAATNGAANVPAVQQLTKIATELANADEAAQIKQAQMYGAAAFDGFLQRANQYAANTPQAPQAPKVAAIQPIPGQAAQFGPSPEAVNAWTSAVQPYQKTAAEVQMEKQAAEAGYREADTALTTLLNTKTAADAQMEKQAAEAGYAETHVAIETLRTGTKTAAQKANEDAQGVRDAAEKTAAMAEDCFIRGYNEMHKIAGALNAT